MAGDNAEQLKLLDPVPAARQAVMDSFRDLVGDLALKAQADPEHVGPTVAAIEGLIEGVNTSARARKTRRANHNAETVENTSAIETPHTPAAQAPVPSSQPKSFLRSPQLQLPSPKGRQSLF
jgi:hypothetical protein